MAKIVVPIKVKIGLRPNGHADHPDWMKLPLAIAGGSPKDHMGGGWYYDKTSGHKEETPDSPFGQQWGLLLVTPQFASEAVATFPALVTVLNEVDAQGFWDNKVRGHMPDNRTNTELLVALKTERDLRVDLGLPTTAIDARITRALDPDDPEPGVVKDKMRRWVDAKKVLNIEIQP